MFVQPVPQVESAWVVVFVLAMSHFISCLCILVFSQLLPCPSPMSCNCVLLTRSPSWIYAALAFSTLALCQLPSCLSSESFVCNLILSLVVCFWARCLCASVWSGLCFHRPPCVILHFVFPLSKIMTCMKGLVLKMLHRWDLFFLFVFCFFFFFFSFVWIFTLYCALECHPWQVKFYCLGQYKWIKSYWNASSEDH